MVITFINNVEVEISNSYNHLDRHFAYIKTFFSGDEFEIEEIRPYDLEHSIVTFQDNEQAVLRNEDFIYIHACEEHEENL